MKRKFLFCLAVSGAIFASALGVGATPTSLIKEKDNYYFAQLSNQVTNYCFKHHEICAVAVLNKNGMPYLISGNSCAVSPMLAFAANKALASAYFGLPGDALEKKAQEGGALFRYQFMTDHFFKLRFLPGSYPLFNKHQLIGGVGILISGYRKGTMTESQLAKRFALEWGAYLKQSKIVEDPLANVKTGKGSVAAVEAVKSGVQYCQSKNLKCFISFAGADGSVRANMHNIGVPLVMMGIADSRAATAAFTGRDTSSAPLTYKTYTLKKGDMYGGPLLVGGKPIFYKGVTIGGVGVGVAFDAKKMTQAQWKQDTIDVTNIVYLSFLHHYYPLSVKGCKVVL